MSDSLWPYGLKHCRLPCHSLSPTVCSNLCSLSQWCYLTSHPLLPLLLLPSIFPSIGVVSNDALHIRGPKNWSFSFRISPSNDSLGLSSFKIDWFYLLVVQGTQKSLLQHCLSIYLVIPTGRDTLAVWFPQSFLTLLKSVFILQPDWASALVLLFPLNGSVQSHLSLMLTVGPRHALCHVVVSRGFPVYESL